MVLLLWTLYVIYVSCLSCFLVYSLQPCGYLLGKGWSLGLLVCDVFLCFVTSQCGVLVQVSYLIVLIPNMFLLTCFEVIGVTINDIFDRVFGRSSSEQHDIIRVSINLICVSFQSTCTASSIYL